MSALNAVSTGSNPSDYRQFVTPGWHPQELPCRVLYVGLTLFFAVVTAAGLIGYYTRSHPPNDFFAFASYSRFVRHHAPSSIYDQSVLRVFQAMPGHKVFAFMYPPAMLLLLWPLALVRYSIGYGCWVGIGLAACVTTVGARRGAWPLGVLTVVAPSTLWTALCGQSTLFLAALIAGGLLLSRRKPIVAGVLIGIATYKPQLGILVPVALAASGQWRTVASAGVTFLSLVMASTAAFGHDVWLAWMSHLNTIVDVRTQHATSWASLFSTVASDFVTLGVDRRLADFGQALSAAAVATCIWRAFRHNDLHAERMDGLKVALLCVATFLATPFAFIYDLPLFTLGLLLFVRERLRSGETFHSLEILVIVGGLLDPCVFLINGAHCFGSLVILLALLVILRRMRILRLRSEDVITAGAFLSGGPATA